MFDENISSVLLIAQHAGIMARSLARAGIFADAVDRFGDEDLFPCVNRYKPIKTDGEGNVDLTALQQDLEILAPQSGTQGVIYGSGMDTQPYMLKRVASGTRILIGNCPDTLALINTPPRFFALLDNLSIAYPETRYSAPPISAGWLCKQGCSEGGKGVAFCAQIGKIGQNKHNAYFQRHVPGNAMSALFIAQSGISRIIGFNTLWSEAAPDRPFLFAGAVNRADLSCEQRKKIGEYIARLTAACGLVGLNSLDFVQNSAGVLQVLELNPRPSSSLMLYDEALPKGLMLAHIRACIGKPWTGPDACGDRLSAFRILFAPRIIDVPAGLSWPEWCLDRPRARARIAEGEPLCTITTQQAPAALPDAAAAERLLEQRACGLLAMLERRIAADRPMGIRPTEGALQKGLNSYDKI